VFVAKGYSVSLFFLPAKNSTRYYRDRSLSLGILFDAVKSRERRERGGGYQANSRNISQVYPGQEVIVLDI